MLSAIWSLIKVGGLVRTVTQDVLPMVKEARKVVQGRREQVVEVDGGTPLDEIRARLERLEASNSRQAEMLAGLSVSVEELSRNLEAAARGARTLLVTMAVAVALAVAALAVALWG